MIIKLKLLSAI